LPADDYEPTFGTNAEASKNLGAPTPKHRNSSADARTNASFRTPSTTPLRSRHGVWKQQLRRCYECSKRASVAGEQRNE
jgi:hypothetical protein